MAKMLIKIYCTVAALVFGLCALVALNVGLTLAALGNMSFVWWLAGGGYCFTATIIVDIIGKVVEPKPEDWTD